MRFYVEVARTAFRRQLVYRWANLAGLCTNAFFAAVASFVALALFRTRGHVHGFSVHDTLRYIWLVQAMIMVVLPFGAADLLYTIRSGEVVADLSKPCDFFWYWCSRDCGRAVYYLIFRATPTYLLGLLLFGIGAPGRPQWWLFFAGSLLLGAMLGIAYRFLYNVVAFWIIDGRAVAGLAENLALFCTGAFVPLAFFPGWLRGIDSWLPFNGLMNLPAEVFLGKLTGGVLLFEVARQLGWLLLLVAAARRLSALAARRVVSQGG